MNLDRRAARQAVVSAAFGICALDETELFERLESLYWLGAKASLDALTPPDLHPATPQPFAAKVFGKRSAQRCAAVLAGKLHAAEKKYGFADGWRNKAWMDECREALQRHVAKGDPLDVAAYCAFLWHHGELTAIPPAPPAHATAEPALSAHTD